MGLDCGESLVPARSKGTLMAEIARNVLKSEIRCQRFAAYNNSVALIRRETPGFYYEPARVRNFGMIGTLLGRILNSNYK